MTESPQWIPVDLDAYATQKFNEILPAGRVLELLEMCPLSGALRVTLDDGTQRVVQRQSKPQ